VDASLRLAPLFSGARLLADMVASLPLQQYRKAPGGKPVKLATSPLLDQPAAYGTVYDWLFQAMTSLVLQGNAWGLITGRDGYGYPTGIEWLPAERVTVVDDEAQPWNPQRARVYFYGNQMRREDLFHIRAFTVPGRLEGLSPLRLFMTLIGAGNDALEYGASWYRAGGWPPGTFENVEQEVDKDAADEIRRRLTNSIRRREPLVHGRDWKYTPIAVPPNEAQFIEAQQMSATQIAAILGLPPERIGGKRGDSLTYSTQEQESISLVVDTLRPWLVRIETALFNVLPVNCYVRFNPAAMLKTTTQQRHEIYKLDRDIGLLTINEIRELEELKHMDSDIGDDPIPLEVLVGMSRGIKEIPKSFEDLVSEGPADKLARLAQAEAAKAKLTGPGPAPPAAAPAAPTAEPVQAPNPTGQQSRWLGDYQASEDSEHTNGVSRG
jgi:HK97 family phage portal protein